MKRQIWLTAEQRDLLIDITMFVMSEIKADGGINYDTQVRRMCKKYCDKRTQELLDILTRNPSKPPTKEPQ